MKHIWIYLIVVVLSFFSCVNSRVITISENKNIYTVNFDSIEQIDVLKYSDIFKSAKVIILDNKKQDALIGNVDKVQPYKDRLFVLDSSTAKGICEFDKNGKFIRKIGGIGNAPGEYVQCTDFTLNNQTKEILVYDSYHRRISKYDLQTGKYKDHINIEGQDGINRIWSNNGQLYAVVANFTGNEEEPYYILQQINETTGDKIGEWMESDRYNKGWKSEFLHTNAFYSTGSNIDLFAFGLGDSIMCIHEDKLYPYIVLTGKDILRKEDIPQDLITSSPNSGIRYKKDNAFFKLLMGQNKYVCIMHIFGHKQNIYIDYFKGRSFHTVRYNTATKKSSIFGYFEDDILFHKSPGSGSIPQFLTSDEHGVYYLIKTDYLPELKHYAMENGVISESVGNKEELKKLDEDSNPVILYYEYKE